MSIIRRSYLLGGAFDPGTVEGLVHRYLATESKVGVGAGGGTAPGIGDPIGRLFDQVGSEDLAAPSSGQRPTLASVDGALGGDFDGVDDYLEAGSKAPFNFLHEGAASVIVRIQIGDTNSGALQPILGTMTFSTIYTGAVLIIDDRPTQGGENRLRFGINRSVAGQAVYDFNRTSDSLDSAGLTSGIHTVGAAWDASTARLFFDGAALGPAISAAYALPTGDSHIELELGRSGATGLFDGVIFEALFYDRKLTADEMATVMQGINS